MADRSGQRPRSLPVVKVYLDRLATQRTDKAETDADGWQLTIEIFGVVIHIGIAR